MKERDNPKNILGANNADNGYNSSSVTGNADGSIIERLEVIQGKLGAVDGADNPIGADDADNGFASTNVVANEDGSILERLEQLQEAVNKGTGTALAANKSLVDAIGSTGSALTDGTTSVVGILGVNDNDNSFDSTNVVANADGSVLERLEYVQASEGVNYTAIIGTNDGGNALLGTRVQKSAADIFDGTATPGKALFTVSGGRVLITSLTIEVGGAAIDNTACNTKITYNPTVGTDLDLCANLDIDSDEQGTLYSITGTFTDALTGGTGGGVNLMDKRIIVAEGTLGLTTSADAGTGGATGACEIWYIPLDSGASVASA